MSAVLTFEPDGTIGALYTEEIDLPSLGRISRVRRITHIDYNVRTELWEVRWAVGEPELLYAHKSREACLGWERANQEELYDKGEVRWQKRSLKEPEGSA